MGISDKSRNAECSEDPFELFQAAIDISTSEKPEKALRYYEKALTLEVDPEEPWVCDMIVGYGECLLKLERYSEALNLESIYEEFKENPKYIFLMGLIYLNCALFEKAIDSFALCTRMSSDKEIGLKYYIAYYYCGVIEESLGNLSKAREYYSAGALYPPSMEGVIRTTDRSFFLDEVRDGFFVPGFIKRLWYSAFQSYKALERYCDDIGIKCYVSFGTLIGVVRGGGFIPWDDDIDTAMNRHSYVLLKESSKIKKLPIGYGLYDYHDSEDDNVARKWINADYIVLNDKRTDIFGGFPYAVNIDIFMIDYFPDEERREGFLDTVKLLTELKMLLMARNHMDTHGRKWIEWDRDRYETIKSILEKRLEIKISISSEHPITDVMDLLEEYYLKNTAENCQNLSEISYYLNNSGIIYPKWFFDKWIEMPFERLGTVRVPLGYDYILRQMYGKYMNANLGSFQHEYPYYLSYERMNKEDNGKELPKYVFDKNQYLDAVNIRNESLNNHPSREKEKWLFLCTRSVSWGTMKSIWRDVLKDPSKDVKVVDVPYYYKDNHGEILKDNLINESKSYPDEVRLTPYEDIDIRSERPDVIVFNCPYDEYGDGMSVIEDYYASNFFEYAKQIIFIPPFKVREVVSGDVRSEYTLGCFLRNPGLIYSDKIYVQSESMKSVYLRILSGFTGGESENNSINWNERFVVDCSVFADFTESSKIRRLMNKDSVSVKDRSNGRKVILLRPSVSALAIGGNESIKKIKKALEVINDYPDHLYVVWQEDKNISDVIPDLDSAVWDNYCNLRDDFIEMEVGFYDKEESFMIDEADLFYGDGSEAMNICRMNGKIILWETPGVEVRHPEGYQPPKEFPDSFEILTEGEWYLEDVINHYLSRIGETN